METPKVRVRVAPLTKTEKMNALVRLSNAQMELCNDIENYIISNHVQEANRVINAQYSNFK